MSDQILWTLKHFSQLTALEIYRIIQAREAVFVVEQACPYLESDGKDPVSHHLYGCRNGVIAAYCRIVPPLVSFAEPSIGRVITTKAFRGQKLGHALIARAVEECQRLFGDSPIRISAQAHLRDFYSLHGFKVVSDPYLEDNIPHVEMVLENKLVAVGA